MKTKQKKTDTDEVLDELIREVKAVVAHAPLYLALGSKAMQPRHWQKVYALLDVTQTSNLDDSIKFEKLIEDRAEDFAGEIEDISGMAMGEMQIETTMQQVIERWENTCF